MFEEINDLDFENPSVDIPLEDEINLFECNGFVNEDEVEDSPLKELYKLLYQFAPSLCKTPVDIKEEILYEHLMKLQQEDSDWYFNIDFEGIKVEKEEQVTMWHMQILVS
ncbi:hypothetical protein RhiirA4_474698 [Rhizophagus irregularis]|uniref:Uncharacterized protein n=1 Tax=Rhizophagus irregularis TaxID=588596 RepID=A0A2I1H8Z4_9GLOM|nr:hypothetical protein RhiirA4_474698 [Rhizophagus irregularis]